MDFQSWDMLALLVFALLGAALSFFGLKRAGDPPVSPAPPGPSPTQVAEDKKEAAEELKAQEKHEQQVVEATKEHDQAVSKETQELVQKTEQVKDDPVKVNDSLLDIGKKIRE